MDKPKVIFENKDFAVVDKPAGWVVHAAKVAENKKNTNPKDASAPSATPPLLTDWLVKKYPEIKTVGDEPVLRPGIVHRLDKGTSGVMLVPRNQKTFEYLKLLFQKHEIKKTYVALVAGALKKDEGMIDAPIGIRNGTIKRSIRSPKMAKPAITKYKVIKRFADGDAEYSLLEVYPQTGRTHQIRVHLASIGHPIVGDPLYGRKKQPAWATRLMLHAKAVEFVTEAGKRVKFEASYPQKIYKGVPVMLE